MKAFILGIDQDIWDIVEHGIIPTETNSPETSKEQNEMPSNEGIKMQIRSQVLPFLAKEIAKGIHLDAKIRMAIYNGLASVKYKRIANLKTVKEIWNHLKLVHEGTERVKKTNLNIFLWPYESFT